MMSDYPTDDEWIDEHFPEHERTSCNDRDLYNASTLRLYFRCGRCEALSFLKKLKLIAATKEVITAVNDVMSADITYLNGRVIGMDGNVTRQELEALRAAIAKAEGVLND